MLIPCNFRSAPRLALALMMIGAPLSAARAAAQGDAAPSATRSGLLQWEPHDIVLGAAEAHPWWEFPVRAEFTHNATGTPLTIEGFWEGGRCRVVRFAAPLPGTWT